jgi:hypothetical protein
MIPGFERIVEERIKSAQKGGAFNDLPGTGKPLDLEDDEHVPQDLRLAYKILKNADCLPPEIEAQKEIQRTEDLLAAMKDTAERYRILTKLNFLILKVNSARKGDVRFEVPQRYAAALGEKITIRPKADRPRKRK